MLRKLRQKDIKKIMWALVIVIVPAFAFWGISSVVQSRSRPLGIIEGRKISAADFRNYEKNLQMFMFFSYGPDFFRKIKNQELIMLTWQQMLLAQAAKNENIKANDQELLQKLKSLPLLNQQGRFNQSFYLSRLKAAGIVPSRFENFLKDVISVDKLVNKIRSSVTIGDNEVLKLYREEHEKAKISYLFIDYDKLSASFHPQEKDLRKYFRDHKDDFRIPPKVRISYIVIPHSQLSQVYRTIKKLGKNYTLEKIAKELSLKIETSDYFSLSEPIKNLGWVKEINEIAFSLIDGQTSKPLALSSDKLIIIKRLEGRESFLPTFKGTETKVKKAYLKYICRQKAEKIAQRLLNIIKEKRINNMEELIRSLPPQEQEFVILKSSPYFQRYSYLEDIGFNKELYRTVFNTPVGKIIDKYFLLPQGIVIIKVEDLIPIDKKKFLSEKEKYRQRLLSFKQQLALRNYITTLYKNSRFFASTLP